MTMADVDLDFLARQCERIITIARQCERIITEVGMLRDDNRVLAAMVQRLDGTTRALLDEVQAMHTQIARMNDRTVKLESP
jgi:small-conductance mechanosensitive channel